MTCCRSGVAILTGVTFQLAPGECLALRGPNGVGKTTLLRTLAGIARAGGGQLSVDLEEVAYIGHLDGVNLLMTVEENLCFWSEIFGQKYDQSAISGYSLEEFASLPAKFLSAGQKRRLALATIAASGREIWLLDEPATSLDRSGIATFESVLRRHCAAGGIAVVATHTDLAIANSRTLELAPYRERARRIVSREMDPFK